MQGFYHYTSARKWAQMQDIEDWGESGLLPLRRFVDLAATYHYKLPEKAGDGAIFGLPEPLPRPWLDNRDRTGHSLLETIIRNMSDSDDLVLLFAKAAKDDDLHVADWSPHLHPEYNSPHANEKIARKVKHAYFNSLTPFFNYAGQHKVPAIICFSKIPLNRLQVIEKLPRWKLINRIRAGADLPLVMPPHQPRTEILDQFLMR